MAFRTRIQSNNRALNHCMNEKKDSSNPTISRKQGEVTERPQSPPPSDRVKIENDWGSDTSVNNDQGSGRSNTSKDKENTNSTGPRVVLDED